MNRFRYLNTSIFKHLAVFFVQGWWDQGPGFAGGSCGFWFQESSLLLFSISSIFFQCVALNVGTRIALHVRDVGGLGICIMGGSVLCFYTWNCWQWTPVLCWPLCSFPLFVFATWGLWWCWCGIHRMASFLLLHPRTTRTTICSTSSLLLLIHCLMSHSFFIAAYDFWVGIA